MATTRLRLGAVARLAAWLFLASVAACGAISGRAETVSASSFKIEIADSMTWVDNREDPYVSRKISRMTPMQRDVVASRPYIRITNLAQPGTSSAGDLYRFDLDLTNTATQVTGVEWIKVPGRATWGWDAAGQFAHFNMFDPLRPGDDMTLRLATSALDQNPDDYQLIQNYFAPMLGSTTIEYGILKLYAVAESTLFTPQAMPPDGRIDIAGIQPIEYNLRDFPIDYYSASSSLVGIEIQAVPEPSSIALLAAAGLMGCLAIARRRAVKRAA